MCSAVLDLDRCFQQFLFPKGDRFFELFLTFDRRFRPCVFSSSLFTVVFSSSGFWILLFLQFLFLMRGVSSLFLFQILVRNGSFGLTGF